MLLYALPLLLIAIMMIGVLYYTYAISASAYRFSKKTKKNDDQIDTADQADRADRADPITDPVELYMPAKS